MRGIGAARERLERVAFGAFDLDDLGQYRRREGRGDHGSKLDDLQASSA